MQNVSGSIPDISGKAGIYVKSWRVYSRISTSSQVDKVCCDMLVH